jgi:hypothetical protein
MKKMLGSAKFATTITCCVGLLSSIVLANAADLHEVAPGFNATNIQHLGVVTLLFTLPYDRLKELCEVEPGLPDLTLWYRVQTVDAAFTTEDGADDYMIESNIMDLNSGVITAVVIPKSTPPPAKMPNLSVVQNYLLPNSATDNGIDAQYLWKFPGDPNLTLTLTLNQISQYMTLSTLGIFSTRTWQSCIMKRSL